MSSLILNDSLLYIFILCRVTNLVEFLTWFLFYNDNEKNDSNNYITSPLLMISALYFLGCQSKLLPALSK